MSIWLTVIGVGADGLASLASSSRALVENAEVLVGGERHLGMIERGPAERIVIKGPMKDVIAALKSQRERRVVILASGDPLHYGMAATLLDHIAPDEMSVIPHHSSFTLACAQLKWPRQHVATVSVHGRPLESLHRHIYPGARLLVLAHDGDTPARIAALLSARGFGPSRMVALENLGADGVMLEATAQIWNHARSGDLVIVGIECRAGAQAIAYSTVPGLPDDAFEHDGQITKREVRAVTLSALAPLPGQRLWDVGAGAGSIAIEWLRAAPNMRAIAIERDGRRADRIARNALTLGVPELSVVRGTAPDALAGLEAPNAIFIGGGVSNPGVIDTCWSALSDGGRLVANAVTIDSEAVLARHQRQHGGSLTRIAVSRAETFNGKGGNQTEASGGWRALAPITQLCAVKH